MDRVQYEYAQTIEVTIKIKTVNNLPKLENMCSALLEIFPFDLRPEERNTCLIIESLYNTSSYFYIL